MRRLARIAHAADDLLDAGETAVVKLIEMLRAAGGEGVKQIVHEHDAILLRNVREPAVHGAVDPEAGGVVLLGIGGLAVVDAPGDDVVLAEAGGRGLDDARVRNVGGKELADDGERGKN